MFSLAIFVALLLSPEETRLDTSSLRLDEVTVTAVRSSSSAITSQSSVEVSAQRLSEELQSSLSQSLSSVAGVQTSSIGSGQSRPIIRGLGLNRVSVVHDGVRHEGQQWGDDHGLEIDRFAIDRIEILKGPGALLYGPDAIGGVLLLSSARKPERRVGGAAHLFVRTNNLLLGTSVRLEGSLRRFYWRLNATYQDYTDYMVPADSFEYYSYRIPLYQRTLRNTAGREADASLTLGYSSYHFHTSLRVYETCGKSGFFANAHGLEVRLSEIDYDRSRRDIDLPMQGVNHLKVLWNTVYNQDHWRAEVNASWQHNLRREDSEPVSHGYMPTPPDSKERQFSKHTGTLNALARWDVVSKHTLRFGFQSELQHNRRSGWGFILPDFEQYRAGVYALEEWRVTSSLTLNGGIRYDYVHTHIHPYTDWFATVKDGVAVYQERSADLTRHFHSFTWSAGVRYTQGGWYVRGNIGKAFRAPIPKELGVDGINYHVFRYEAGNGALHAEESYQADVSVTWGNAYVQVQVDPFVGYFPNYIYLSPTSEYREGLQLYRYTQTQVVRAGAEAKISVHPWQHMDVSVQGEYLFSRQLSGTKRGYGLPFSPPWRLMPEVRFKWSPVVNSPLPGYAAIDIRVSGAQYDIVPPEKPSEGWWTLNLAVGQQFVLPSLTLSVKLKADNILNTKYYDHTSYYRLIDIPEAGWNLSAMLSVEF